MAPSIESAASREQVFLSYAHEDQYWLAELLTMLKPLLKRRPISIWCDKEISPGQKWYDEIHAALSVANIAILLVSKHFLASDFITEDELPAILKMRESGLNVLWIPISHCLYHDTELQHLQALHDVAQPLDSLEDRQRNEALFAICASIRDILAKGSSVAPTPAAEASFVPATGPAVAPGLTPPRDQAEKQETEINLLFGAVAVQNQFINPTQFAESCVVWSLRKEQSLAEILMETQGLSVADRDDVQRLVDRRLRVNAGNVTATLRASTDSTVCEVLRQSRVPEVLRSLDELHALDGSLVAPFAETPLEWRGVLREGTLGEIWSGFDPTLGREVALKVVRRDRAGQPAAHARLLQEARIDGRLEHPHIVPVYDLGIRESGEPYYSMRLVRGPTLAEDIARHHQTRLNDRVDTIERRRLLENFLSVCHAVSYAHSRGFLHLDLKPQNVVLGEFREVYLLDWGLSQTASLGAADAQDETLDTNGPVLDDSQPASRKLIGTPSYMSPEQAAGDPARFDARTDVYGLGAMLFEVLTGEPPYQGDDLEQTLSAIQVGPSPAPIDRLKTIPPSLSELAVKALSREPSDRFATAEDFALAVERWLDDEPLAVYRDNIERYEQKIKEEPENSAFQEGLARNLVTQGLVLFGVGRLAAAEFSLRQGIDILRSLLKSRKSPSAQADLATACLHLHYLLRDAGKAADAEAAKRDALALYFELRQASPGRDGQHSILLPMFTMHFDGVKLEQLMEEVAADPASATPSASVYDSVDLPGALSDAGTDISDDQPPTGTIHESVDFPVPLADAGTNVSDDRPPPGAISDVEPDRSADLSVTFDGPSPISPAKSQSLSASKLLRIEQRKVERAEEERLLSRVRETWENREFLSERVVGEGGSSVVYQARDVALDRVVALKTAKQSNDKHLPFFSEAILTADLTHPNIPPIYTTGVWPDGRPFFTMPLLKGSTWDRELARQDLPAKLEILLKVSDAVAFAHSRGVVHRDIKPENVMLGEFGEVLLLDWGLAFRGSTGTMGGTPAYMAPEMATGPFVRVGVHSDVYLLGAVLFEILTGRPPHTGKDALKCLMSAAKNEIVSTDCTGELIEIAYKAMRTDPVDRYLSVPKFQQAIRDYQRHAESLAISERALEVEYAALRSDERSDFWRSVHLLEEALLMWNENRAAREAVSRVRLAAAERALHRRDFSEGLEFLLSDDPVHAELSKKIRQAQREFERRASRQRRTLRITFVGLACAAIVLALLFEVWVLFR